MGRLGYQSDAQSSLKVSYNSLESYAASLQDALTRPYPPYEDIGVRTGDDYRQLATSMLQIENEFYGTIRPKRVIRPGERPLHALRERGVEYVEVRLMDLDPFCPIGITRETLDFLDMYLLNCLLRDSPPDTPDELDAIVHNKQRVASRGREPGLKLADGIAGGDARRVGRRGARRMRAHRRGAGCREAERSAHRDALASAVAALNDPACTPSARMLDTMARDHGNSYVRFVLAQSAAHRETLLALPLVRRRRGALRATGRGSRWPSSVPSRPPTRCRSHTFLEHYLSPASLNV